MAGTWKLNLCPQKVDFILTSTKMIKNTHTPTLTQGDSPSIQGNPIISITAQLTTTSHRLLTPNLNSIKIRSVNLTTFQNKATFTLQKSHKNQQIPVKKASTPFTESTPTNLKPNLLKKFRTREKRSS